MGKLVIAASFFIIFKYLIIESALNLIFIFDNLTNLLEPIDPEVDNKIDKSLLRTIFLENLFLSKIYSQKLYCLLQNLFINEKLLFETNI